VNYSSSLTLNTKSAILTLPEARIYETVAAGYISVAFELVAYSSLP